MARDEPEISSSSSIVMVDARSFLWFVAKIVGGKRVRILGYAKILVVGYATHLGQNSWRERVCVPKKGMQKRTRYAKFLPADMALKKLGLGTFYRATTQLVTSSLPSKP